MVIRGQVFQLPYTPFIFSKTTLNAPTTFNIIIAIDGVQYEYGFVMDKDKIYAEWLYAGSKTMFTRELENPASTEFKYEFPGTNLTGQKKIWEKSTRPDSLFLSTAVGLNSSQLKPIYDWFNSTLEITNNTVNNLDMGKTTNWCDSEQGKQEVINFLKAADIFITDIYAKEQSDLTKAPIEIKQLIETMKATTPHAQIRSYDIQFKHPTDYDDGVFLGFQNESDGTKKMYNLAGYWLEALQKNKVIFFDELNNSLHPLLVRFLINKFNSEKNNTNAPYPDSEFYFPSRLNYNSI